MISRSVVEQMPQASIFTSASHGPGSGGGRSRSSHWFTRGTTRAFMGGPLFEVEVGSGLPADGGAEHALGLTGIDAGVERRRLCGRYAMGHDPVPAEFTSRL